MSHSWKWKSQRFAAVILLALSATLLVAPALFSAHRTQADQDQSADLWSQAETVSAADFVRELGAANASKSPTIVYAGFRTLFEGGHVSGAVFHGTASTEKGLAELQQWLAGLPRSTNLVLYCGCCPFARCPNIRPAYKAVHQMGFTHVRVLVLPTSFAADWVEKGYPMSKGL